MSPGKHCRAPEESVGVISEGLKVKHLCSVVYQPAANSSLNYTAVCCYFCQKKSQITLITLQVVH